jgi:hypothetical protein
MVARNAGRAPAAQVARNLAAAQRSSAKELEKGLRRQIARGVQEFAVRSMNELAQRGPAWSGEFSQSWVFGAEGQTPVSVTAGARSGIGRYGKADAPVREIERHLDRNVSRFTILNTASHAAIAIDEEMGVFKHQPEPPLKEPDLGSGRDQPSLRHDIGEDFAGPEGQHSASRTAEEDWFDTYVKGGGLNKDLRNGFSYGFQDIGQ